MTKFFTYFTLLVAGFFTSCEVDYVIEQDEFVPQVVVNSVFTENKPFQVHLSFTRHIFDKNKEIRIIPDAKVTITEKATGRTAELLHQGDGIYSYAFFTAKSDYTYELNVLVDGYNPIKAVSRVPLKVRNVNVITESIVLDDKEALQIRFNIKDQNSAYFIWNWISANPKNPIDSSVFSTPDKLVQEVNKVRNLNLKGDDDTNIGFKDDGNEYKKSFVYTNDDTGSSASGSPSENEKYYLRIMSLSKEMYDFYLSFEKYVNDNNQISSISYLPKVYSNIENGLGVFAGYSQKYIEVKK